jgi:pimeloyl-ACP methyl ester carboxylesterase
MTTALVREQAGPISYLIGGSGPPFVLLHGIPGSSLSWEAVGRRLAERYRVVIPDLAGFGASETADDAETMDAQAETMRAFLATLGVNRLVLAGHDFGGPVALTLTRLEPALRVQALVLSATNLFTDNPIPLPLRLAGIPRLGPALVKAGIGTRPGTWLVYRAAVRQKQALTWTQFRRHLTPGSMALTARIFQHSLPDLRRHYATVEAMLPALARPTLVLWGEQDPFFRPAVGRRTHRAIPGAWLRIFPQTGHFVPEEQPDEVAAEILSFLAQSNSG